MKRFVLSVGLVALLSPMTANANTIEKACLSSNRDSANRALCGCIQDVADLTLSNGEQRRAAEFFKNPDKAQDTRQSNRRNDEAFWQRYAQFGTAAQQLCKKS